MTLRLATALLPALYFALAASTRAGPARAAVGWLAVAIHGAAFAAIQSETGVFPLELPGAALSALALSLFVVYACVEWRTKVRGLRGAVVGAVLVLQLVASAIGFSTGRASDPPNLLFVVHVVAIVASVATLLLSGFFGAVYLVVERQMRSQRFGELFARLPKLSELSAMNRFAATIGFLLMTVGLNLGIWQVHERGRGTFSYGDPMVVVTTAAWIVFGIIGLSQWVRFLSGRKAAVTAVGGLVLIVLTVVVSLVPGLSFHRFS